MANPSDKGGQNLAGSPQNPEPTRSRSGTEDGLGSTGIPSSYIEDDLAAPIAVLPLDTTSRHRPTISEYEDDRGDTDTEQTQVDLEPLRGGSLPFQNTSLAEAHADSEPFGVTGQTEELTIDELRSLVISVEPSEGRSERATPTEREEQAAPMHAGDPENDDNNETAPHHSRLEAFPLPTPLAVVTIPSKERRGRGIDLRDIQKSVDIKPAGSAGGKERQTTDRDEFIRPSRRKRDSTIDRVSAARAPKRVPIVGGRYRIIERVGSGGMGKVFKVVHTTLGKTFALKIIADDLARENKARELFYREARLASSLSHPNVTSIVDFGEDAAVGAFMVMEFLNGELLTDRLDQERRLSVRLAAEIIRQVAEALDYIHNKGIVHCDIKTENILLTEVPGSGNRNKLQVKVLDFGLARSTSGGYDTGSVGGTPHYVAPERLRGEQATPSNDIYALGILFYELLTGRVPWDGSVDDILAGHLDLEPTPPSQLIKGGLDPAVEKLVLRALAKEPADRHKNVAAFLYELQTVMDMLGYGRRKGGARRLKADGSPRRAISQRDKIARALFDASRIPMALINRKGVIIAANPAFARFIMGVAVDVEGLQVQTTTLVGAWGSFETDLARACDGKSVRRNIKVESDSHKVRRLVMWLDPGLKEDQAIFGVHPLAT